LISPYHLNVKALLVCCIHRSKWSTRVESQHYIWLFLNPFSCCRKKYKPTILKKFTVDEVEQCCVIQFLMLKGCNAEQIHDRLARVYGDDTFLQSTVYKWMREFRLERNVVGDLPRVEKRCLDDIDGAIVEKLNKHPFHSCRSLAEDVCVAPSTV
jgi:hypothetical protein